MNRVDCVITLPAKNSKNKKQRTLEYGKSKELKDLIERCWKRKLEIEARLKGVKITHVFCHDNGRQIKDFRRSWESACESAGLKGKLFHDLRRSGIKNMLKAGITEKTAMGISGHRTRSVFDRYDVQGNKDRENAVAKIGLSREVDSQIDIQTDDSTDGKTLSN